MTDEEFKRYQILKNVYEYSESPCDLIEYLQKKKNLLHEVCEWLLMPYYQEIEKRKREKDEDPSKD